MRVTAGVIGLAVLTGAAGAAGPAKKPPYWASISARQARMRTGPDRSYPANWLYVRPDLPVHVLAAFKDWRKVEDPAGEQGWMQANLLSETRTGFVKDAVELRASPSAGAKIAWRALPGVIGRLSECTNGWCRFDAHGQAGYVEEARLWGVEPGESLP